MAGKVVAKLDVLETGSLHELTNRLGLLESVLRQQPAAGSQGMPDTGDDRS